MKHSIKSTLLGGVLLFVLSMCLTSCEGSLDDVFGEWSKPTGNATSGGGSGTDGGSSASVSSLTFIVTNLKLGLNSTTPETLTATISPSDATITWSSSDDAVATVDATGKVTPVAVGTATITAKAGDKTAECPVYVYAGKASINDGDVTVTSGEWYIEGDGTEVTNTITIADGASAILDGININNSAAGTTPCIICQGDATITLADGSNNTITAKSTFAAIQAGGNGTDGKKLIIKAETAGTGKLTATAGSKAAAIGSNYDASCGDIEIQGGDITANGGSYAAGIGSGMAGGTTLTCGVITISNGKVTANGGANGGSGIGTGSAVNGADDNQNGDQTCTGITISGGIVVATGGNNENGYSGGGAGIGTGGAKSNGGCTASQKCTDITISGGDVTANGGSFAAGIGTGYVYYDSSTPKSSTQKCDAITISGGTVTAKKGSTSPNSVGVGGKKTATGTYASYGSQTCTSITIGGDATTYAAGVATSPFNYPLVP